MQAFAGQTCIALVLITALVHSWAGERLLIAPMLRRRRDPATNHPLGRFVLRFGWHMMSLSFLAVAAILWASLTPEPRDEVFLPIGIVLTGAGLFDMIATRGRHIGWPLLLLSGVAGLLAV